MSDTLGSTPLQRRAIEADDTSESQLDTRAGIPLTSLEHDSSPRSDFSATVVDDVPDGGYGWVIVAACSTITYANLSHMGLVPDLQLSFYHS